MLADATACMDAGNLMCAEEKLELLLANGCRRPQIVALSAGVRGASASGALQQA